MNKNNQVKNNKSPISIRESFSARLLSNAQFDEAMAITGILEREILKSGSFKDKLGDYAYAMARSERMDVSRAETVLRDLFKERTGQTMNQMREALAERDGDLNSQVNDDAYSLAIAISDIMEQGEKLCFFRAFADQAESLARQHDITDAMAKKLMREVFEETEEQPLLDWGKELDENIYRPQIDAERTKRSQASNDRGANSTATSRGARNRQAANQRPAP